MSNEEKVNTEEAENTAVQETEEQSETQATQNAEAQEPVSPETVESATPEESVESVQTESGEQAQANAEVTEDVKPEKPAKAKKPVKESSPESAAKKRKLFKLIYYPVLAVFVALMFIFSIVDGAYGYSPNAYGDGYYKSVNAHIETLSESTRSVMAPTVDNGGNAYGVAAARNYIVDTLENGGFYVATEKKQEIDESASDDETQKQPTITDWETVGDVKVPTVTRQTTTLDADIQKEMGISEYLVGAQLTNVIAAIPSNRENAKSVIITVRYDSRTDSVGAADNAAFVANAMQTLIEYVKSGTTFKNDLIVVFTEDLDKSYGAYAFFNAFEGLDNAVSRGIAGISLDAYGNAGTLALVDASGADLDYLNAYSSIAGEAFNSSLVPDSVSSVLINSGAVKAFGNIPAVQVAVLGGLDAAQSPLDTAENISQSIIHQQAQLVKDYIDKFANSDKTYGSKGDSNTAFFSYLDGGTVAYTKVAAYVVGALILAVAAAAIAVMAVKKTFSLKKLFLALAAELLVVVSTLVVMFAAYFLITLMLTGFGVLPLHAITELRYFNAGILIAAMLITLAASFGFTSLYKKLFRITSSDVVRGTAMLFGLAGAVMSFACPAYSFMTSWLGLLMLAVLLVSACVHKIFKAKFGIGMDQLYLYAIPVAFCLPLIMAQIPMLMWLLPMTLLPVILTPFTAMLGVAVPYLDRTRAIFDKVAKKLPKRTIRVERIVTEKVEDRAKKGKFTEKTFKKVEKEKVAVNYKNYFGISVVAVLGVVIALFSGGFGVSFDKTLTGYHTYADAIYNNALVYELTANNGSVTNQSIVVDDLMAYKFFRYSITDLEWDSENGRYSKDVNYDYKDIVANLPTVSSDYHFTTFDGAYSTVTITIPSAKSITKITVKETAKIDGDYEGYVYEFENQETIVLRLPYGFGNFTMEFEGARPKTFEYEEQYTVKADGSDGALDNIDEWNRVKADYAGTDVANSLRGGIVIKSTLSI